MNTLISAPSGTATLVQELSLPLTDDEIGLACRLVSQGHLDQSKLQRIESISDGQQVSFPQLLIRLGLVTEQDLARSISEETGTRLINASDLPDIAVALNALPSKFLTNKQVLPLQSLDDLVVLAMANPLDQNTRNAIRLATKKEIEVVTAEASLISEAISRLYGDDAHDRELDRRSTGLSEVNEEDVERLRDLASEAPVIRMVHSTIERAVEVGASDIHFEPDEHEFRVRFRLDGVLKSEGSHPLNLAAAVVSRIKVMAKLDISERRLPQDGRIQVIARGRTIDLRISTMPAFRGESVVIRVLDRASVKLDFNALGIAGQAYEKLLQMVGVPNGIVLVTGPTGSGKTTTLYTVLSQFDADTKNILTVEDPVEYRLPGIKQVQVNPAIGLDFPRVLRSMLRHDPDIILVGEIRDRETANIAVQAALTGHLVLSTLHTNDAVSSVSRLLDMGVADYLLVSAITGLIAQRLVRKLCTSCRRPVDMTDQISSILGEQKLVDGPEQLYAAVGCEQCENTGYKGRTSILESVPMTSNLRRAILDHEGIDKLQMTAKNEGMTSLFQSGLGKVVEGETTLEEVMRVTQDTSQDFNADF